MIRALILATTTTLALTAAAKAQEDFPTGCYLEEFDESGLSEIYLYWLDGTQKAQLFQISWTPAKTG